jgi:hypothetical protein
LENFLRFCAARRAPVFSLAENPAQSIKSEIFGNYSGTIKRLSFRGNLVPFQALCWRETGFFQNDKRGDG